MGASLWSTSSTSYCPALGNGGSSRGNTRKPGTCEIAPKTSPYISSVERVRCFQSLATKPPKPPHAAVNDHMNLVSGKEVMALTTFNDSRLAAATVESGGASMKRLIWLWSSTGASSWRENM